MQEARRADEGTERGVFEAPYRKDGCVLLVAIDSKGEERKRVKLLPGVSYERAWAWLGELLDRVDPVAPAPKLELVRDARRPAPPRERALHPCHANDYFAYRRRLIRQLSHSARPYRD